MSGRKYYCFCDANCRFETMTKEQILAAIAQAAESGLVFDEDAAFITQVKETNAGSLLKFWVGTQAQYNAVSSKDPHCHYIITDKKEMSCASEAVTLLTGSWYNKRQTVKHGGVKANNIVIVSPDPAADNYAAYAASGVRCESQDDGALTFICEEIPSIPLAVNVAVFN